MKEQPCCSGLQRSPQSDRSAHHSSHLSSPKRQLQALQKNAEALLESTSCSNDSQTSGNEKRTGSGILLCTDSLSVASFASSLAQESPRVVENDGEHLRGEMSSPLEEALDSALADDFQAFCEYVDEVQRVVQQV